MTILFINGSPNKNGNTVALVKRLLRNQEYETLHLADYKIYDYGQDFLDDQFKESHSESLCCGHSGHWLARLSAQYQWLGPQFFGPPIRCGDR